MSDSLLPQLNSPEIKNSHPILKLSPLQIQRQHGLLGLSQRLPALGVEAARVLHPRTQTRRQHASPDLIVLCVGRSRLNGHGSCAQLLQVIHLAPIGGAERGTCNRVDSLPQLASDADANDGMGEVASIENPV